jgi:hypothetical protein
MSPPIRNRIKGHRRVRAGDLVPHELNSRIHPARQKLILEELYREIGFARSFLAYELPDGRLKLIDGHLRRELTPDMEVDVEILDVTDAEARALLLSLDPLASLAETDAEVHAQLRALTPTDSEAIASLWQETAQAARNVIDNPSDPPAISSREQYLILVECRDEEHQRELLQKFESEGLTCRALLS